MTISPDEFKQALRNWASGVCVVTAAAEGQRHGMTVSSFSSVSLSPPLISFCAAESAKTLSLIQQAGRFAVNLLASSQQSVSNHFASRSTEGDRFEGQPYVDGENASPLLHGALAHLECTVHSSLVAGDHEIIVGEITRAVIQGGEPLLFHGGRYGLFRAEG